MAFKVNFDRVPDTIKTTNVERLETRVGMVKTACLIAGFVTVACFVLLPKLFGLILTAPVAYISYEGHRLASNLHEMIKGFRKAHPDVKDLKTNDPNGDQIRAYAKTLAPDAIDTKNGLFLLPLVTKGAPVATFLANAYAKRNQPREEGARS